MFACHGYNGRTGMNHTPSFIHKLSQQHIQFLKQHAIRQSFPAKALIFAEGDNVDAFYIIDSGRVSIYFDQHGQREELCVLGPGDYFGETAIFNQDKRTASVMTLEDAVVYSVDKETFINLVQQSTDISDKLYSILSQRNEELVLRENLVNTTGVRGNKLQISIKGDPSIRETAFYRARYESIVDKVFSELEPVLEELLLQRSVYKVYVGFNSGEIRTSSVFDPFAEEVHAADKLIQRSYIHRHFPEISYQEKFKMISGIYRFIAEEPHFNQLPSHWINIFHKSRSQWKPVAADDISNILRNLTPLRNIPDFYLRNISISIIQDAIRMQFNCDGTHIVSAEDYPHFLGSNLFG